MCTVCVCLFGTMTLTQMVSILHFYKSTPNPHQLVWDGPVLLLQCHSLCLEQLDVLSIAGEKIHKIDDSNFITDQSYSDHANTVKPL